jgi:hypothetical protein
MEHRLLSSITRCTQARVVRYIWTLFADGKGLTKISKRLKRRGRTLAARHRLDGLVRPRDLASAPVLRRARVVAPEVKACEYDGGHEATAEQEFLLVEEQPCPRLFKPAGPGVPACINSTH